MIFREVPQTVRTLSRRSLLYSATAAPLLVRPSESLALDIPPYYTITAANTASTLVNYQQTGWIPAVSLADHYYAGTNLFANMAGNGFNQVGAQILQQMIQMDASFLGRVPSLMQSVSDQIGLQFDPRLFNLNPSYLPSVEELTQAVGGDFGPSQLDFCNQLFGVYSTTNVSLKHRMLERHHQLQRVLLYKYNASPRVRFQYVDASSGLQTLMTVAGVMIAAGAGLIAAALAAPVILGAGAAAGVTAAVLFWTGGGFIAVGAALGVYGMRETLEEMRTTGGPPSSGRKTTPN
jgi:hypothetical protein